MVIFQRCSLYIIDCAKIFHAGEWLRCTMPGVERINNDQCIALVVFGVAYMAVWYSRNNMSFV